MLTLNSPKQNHILAALPQSVYRRLLPRLKGVMLPLGKTLIPANGSLPYVYFPTTSIVSISYGVHKGVMAKTWPVGNEGIVGVSAFLGGVAADNQATVQFAGQAFQLDAKYLRAEFLHGAELQKLLLRYVEALLTQASQSDMCRHHHSIDQRLSRFLLRAFDRMPTDQLAITQERIARLLGVGRARLSEAASRLQADGIIDYRRGQISLLNRRKLKARSCACYTVIRNAFENLHRS